MPTIGVYDVKITTPKDYWVSAVGLYQSEKTAQQRHQNDSLSRRGRSGFCLDGFTTL